MALGQDDPGAIAELAAVQRRREFPTRVTQRMQVMVQDRVIAQVLGGGGTVSAGNVAGILSNP